VIVPPVATIASIAARFAAAHWSSSSPRCARARKVK
jgi:hypothetical protein